MYGRDKRYTPKWSSPSNAFARKSARNEVSKTRKQNVGNLLMKHIIIRRHKTPIWLHYTVFLSNITPVTHVTHRLLPRDSCYVSGKPLWWCNLPVLKKCQRYGSAYDTAYRIDHSVSVARLSSRMLWTWLTLHAMPFHTFSIFPYLSSDERFKLTSAATPCLKSADVNGELNLRTYLDDLVLGFDARLLLLRLL